MISGDDSDDDLMIITNQEWRNIVRLFWIGRIGEEAKKANGGFWRQKSFLFVCACCC